MSRGLAAVLLVSGALASSGCGAAASEPSAQADVMREEKTPDKLIARGRAFAKVGDLTRAEQYLAAALDAGAEVDVALPMLLRVCIAEQRYRAAIAYGEPYLKKRPDDTRLRFVIASLYSNIGETVTAREHLEKVVEAQPDNAEVHFAMGMLALESDGDMVTADGHFREYLRLEPQGTHAAEARSHLLRSMP
ncbi:MAG: tetratricopeptide repeat protein [Polyangiaceae bacterium]